MVAYNKTTHSAVKNKINSIENTQPVGDEVIHATDSYLHDDWEEIDLNTQYTDNMRTVVIQRRDLECDEEHFVLARDAIGITPVPKNQLLPFNKQFAKDENGVFYFRRQE
jgi:hypothetical protein